ncbi:MAG: SoxR reducing system RseC family protein [Pseudomonadota bacterium]
MFKEHGIVVEINDQFAVVETQGTSNHCSQCAGCGTAALLGQKARQVKALNHKGAKVGDQVVIGLEEQALLKSSLALYLMPILGLFAAAIGYEMLVTSAQLPPSEILTVLAGLFGLLAGLKWAKRVTDKMSEDTRYQAVVL